MFQQNVVEEIKSRFVFSKFFPRKSYHYEKIWKKYGTARQGTYDNITGRRRFACWINNATNTFAEYVILFTFPRQQCLLVAFGLHCPSC